MPKTFGPGARNDTKRHRYLDFARQLCRECRGNGAPADLRPYNEACKIERDVQLAELPVDGRLYWLPEKGRYRIEVNQKLPAAFGRFVWCHEIAHTFGDLIDGLGPAQRREERLRADLDSADNEEALCDEIAGELVLPSDLLEPLTERLAPSLLSIIEISRLFRTTVTSAAFRFVQSGLVRCALVLWKAESQHPLTLRAYVRVSSSEREGLAPIPLLEDKDSQPIRAFLTGRLQRGRSLIDLGGGKEPYYCESAPWTHRNHRSVMSLFVLEPFVKHLLQRPHRIEGPQLKLF